MRRHFFALILVCVSPCGGTAEFRALGVPGSQLAALSHDGCVAAGAVPGGAGAGFRWTRTSGAERLPDAIAIQGLSASGDYVAGSVLDDMHRQVAGYWDASGIVHRLASMPDIETIGVVSQAYAVSDEPRVVGSARRPGRGSVAFEWSTETGMRPLPGTIDTSMARALAVSGNGRSIVGWQQTGNRIQVVHWRASGAGSAYEADPGPVMIAVSGTSRDTRVVLGPLNGPDAGPASVVYRWNVAQARLVLTPRPAMPPVQLTAASDDGRLLAGGSGHGDKRVPWLWFESGGFITLADYLAAKNVELPTGWRPLVVTAVSGDGSRIGGWGKRHGDALDSFIVDLSSGSPDCRRRIEERSDDAGRTRRTP